MNRQITITITMLTISLLSPQLLLGQVVGETRTRNVCHTKVDARNTDGWQYGQGKMTLEPGWIVTNYKPVIKTWGSGPTGYDTDVYSSGTDLDYFQSALSYLDHRIAAAAEKQASIENQGGDSKPSGFDLTAKLRQQRKELYETATKVRTNRPTVILKVKTKGKFLKSGGHIKGHVKITETFVGTINSVKNQTKMLESKFDDLYSKSFSEPARSQYTVVLPQGF